MKIKPKHKAIFNGEVCPYCKSTTKVVSEQFVYGRTYSGKSLICCGNYPYCNAYVGTHSDGSSLGRLAKKDLRDAKTIAHHHFDKLWRNNYLTRDEAYEWLSDELGIPEDYTHIGMFNVETCKKVAELCKEELKTYE